MTNELELMAMGVVPYPSESPDGVPQWNAPRGTTIAESASGEYVLASDYERDTYELECKAQLYKLAAEKFRGERDQLRAQVEAMLGQVEGLKDVLAGAHAWMEDATSKVLYPIALHGTDRVAMEAEGLGSCTPDLFRSIDAALQAQK